MADDGSLNIHGTIDSSEIVQGAQDFVNALNGMEQATDKATSSISSGFDSLIQKMREFADSSNTELLQKFQDFADEAAKAGGKISSSGLTLDLSTPKEQLAAFDQDLQKFTDSLTNYFDTLQDKVSALSSMMGSQKDGLSNAPAMPGADTSEIEGYKTQIAGLIEQLDNYKAQLASTREGASQFADEIKGNAIPTMDSFGVSTQGATETKSQLKSELKSLTDEIKSQEGTVNDLKTQFDEAYEAAIRMQSLSSTPITPEMGAGRAEQIKEANTQLDAQWQKVDAIDAAYTEQKSILDEMKAKQVGLNEQMSQSSGHSLRFRTQLMNAREELIKMSMAGQTNSAEFLKAAENAGLLRRQMMGAMSTMNYFADPHRHLTALKTGFQGAAGVAGIFVGAMGLVNDKSAKFAEIQAKCMAIMSLTMGIEQAAAMFTQKSMIYQEARNLQTRARIALEKIVAGATTENTVAIAAETSATAADTVAQGADAVATGTDTVAKGAHEAMTWKQVAAQAALNIVMKMSPIFMIVAAIGAIVGAIALWIHHTDAQKEAQEKQNAKLREQIKLNNEFTNQTAQGAAEQIISYQKLSREYKALGGNMSAQKKFIVDNQSAFQGLGVKIGGVNDANNYLVRHSKDVCNALLNQAKAAAAMNLATKAAEKVIKLDLQKTVKYEKFKGNIGYTTDPYGNTKSYITSTQQDIDKENEKRANKAIKSYLKEKKEALDETNKYLDYAAKVTKDAQNTYKKDGIKTSNGYGSSGSGKGGSNGKNTTKGDTFDASKYNEALNKQKDEESKMDAELAEKVGKKSADVNIQSIRSASQKKIAEMQKTHDDEMREIDKEQGEMLEKKIEAAKDVFKASGKKGKFDPTSVSLSSGELADFQKLRDLSLKSFQLEKEKEQEENEKSLNDFYQKYGTYQEKKLAISNSYAQKINEAETEGQKLTLEKEKENALASLDFSNLKDSINWNDVFSDLGTMTNKALEELARQLQYILDTNKNLAITDIKEITDKIRQIKQVTGQRTNWFYSPTAERDKQIKEEAKQAEKTYDEASAQSAVDKMGVSNEQNNVASILRQSGVNIDPSTIKSSDRAALTKGFDSKSAERVNKALDKLAKAEEKSIISKGKEEKAGEVLAVAKAKENNSLSDFQEKVRKVGEGISTFGAKIKDLPGLLDELGLGNTGVGKAVKSGVSAVNNASGAAADFASGNFIGAAMKGIAAIKDVGSMFGIGGGNEEETAKKIEELTKSNEYLKESIDGLTKKISETSGASALTYGNKAIEAQKRYEENLKNILDAEMNYHSAHHSNAYYFDMSSSSMSTLKNDKELNASWLQNNFDSFKQLTSEQLDYIRTNYSDIWQEILDQGKYDAPKQYWEELADQAGKVKTLTEEMQKSITQVSFDDVYSSFTDLLMNMNTSAEEWSNNFSKYLMKAMLKANLDTQLKSKLQSWYNDFANYNSDNDISESERIKLKQEYDEIVAQGEQIRDATAKATGYDTSSSGTSSSSTSNVSVSQESVSEANGRMTAIEEILAENSINMSQLIGIETITSDTLLMMKEQNLNISSNVSQIVDIQARAATLLSDIRSNTNELPLIKEVLQEIKKDTKNL